MCAIQCTIKMTDSPPSTHTCYRSLPCTQNQYFAHCSKESFWMMSHYSYMKYWPWYISCGTHYGAGDMRCGVLWGEHWNSQNTKALSAGLMRARSDVETYLFNAAKLRLKYSRCPRIMVTGYERWIVLSDAVGLWRNNDKQVSPCVVTMCLVQPWWYISFERRLIRSKGILSGSALSSTCQQWVRQSLRLQNIIRWGSLVRTIYTQEMGLGLDETICEFRRMVSRYNVIVLVTARDRWERCIFNVLCVNIYWPCPACISYTCPLTLGLSSQKRSAVREEWMMWYVGLGLEWREMKRA